MPEQRYASRSSHVLVGDLESFIYGAIAELSEGEDVLSAPFVLYHGPVNGEEDGPVEVCVPKAAGDKTLPATQVAFTAIQGEQCRFPEILGAYEAVYRWVREHGREPDGAAREVYLSGPGEGERLEIAVPLRA